MAFGIYSLLLYTACDVLHPKTTQLAQLASAPAEVAAKLPALRVAAVGTAGVVFVTAMSGAFVAGNTGCFRDPSRSLPVLMSEPLLRLRDALV